MERANQAAAQAKEIERCLSQVKYKIAVCSGKGGVGKTTVAVNLAMTLALQGHKVGILDVDITGPNVPKILNMVGMRPGMADEGEKFLPRIGPKGVKVMSMAFLLESEDTPVIWRGPMKMSAIRQFLAEGVWGELDYLVVDLPPGTSDELLDILQLMQDAGVVVVTTPQDAALNTSRKAVMMAKQMKRKMLGIIENMAGLRAICPKCKEPILLNVFGEGGGAQAAVDYDVPFLGSIPLDITLRERADEGLPITIDEQKGESAKIFGEICGKIQSELKKA
jgi:Mrp family chromosome partitioning ATPase